MSMSAKEVGATTVKLAEKGATSYAKSYVRKNGLGTANRKIVENATLATYAAGAVAFGVAGAYATQNALISVGISDVANSVATVGGLMSASVGVGVASVFTEKVFDAYESVAQTLGEFRDTIKGMFSHKEKQQELEKPIQEKTAEHTSEKVVAKTVTRDNELATVMNKETVAKSVKEQEEEIFKFKPTAKNTVNMKVKSDTHTLQMEAEKGA